jgi:hypothetical protein
MAEMGPHVSAPKEAGPTLNTTVYFDSNVTHDKVTRRIITGCIVFVGNTPVHWTSKHQGAIATSTYYVEMCTAKHSAEEAVAMRYMLRALGIKVDQRTLLIGDTLGMLQTTTNPTAERKSFLQELVTDGRQYIDLPFDEALMHYIDPFLSNFIKINHIQS